MLKLRRQAHRCWQGVVTPEAGAKGVRQNSNQELSEDLEVDDVSRQTRSKKSVEGASYASTPADVAAAEVLTLSL